MKRMKRDKFLTEAMGECRHDMQKVNGLYSCAKCGDEDMVELTFTNFSRWQGFGKLVCYLATILAPYQVTRVIAKALPYDDEFPDRFADAVYEFLNSEEGKRR